MKMFIMIVISVVLSGCGPAFLHYEDQKLLEKLCQQNDGVKRYKLYSLYISSEVRSVKCNNGAKFYYHEAIKE